MRTILHTIFQRCFNIRPNEFLLVQAFFLYYVCIGMFTVVGISVGDSLLLTKVAPQDSTSLYAWMHVAIAVVSILTTYCYDSLMGLFSRTALLIGTQLLLLLSIQVFHKTIVSKVLPTHALVYFGLAVWIRVCSRVLIMLFFSFAGDYFNAHEAKRLYAYIAGGLPVGIVGAGLVTRKLVTATIPEHMLYACIGFLALGVGFSLFIYHKGIPTAHRKYFAGEKPSKVPLRTILGQSYIQLVFLVVLTGMLCFVIVDAQMKFSARNSYLNTTDLAAFFGSYYSYVGIAEVLFQFLLVETFLRRHGIIRSLMLQPCIHIMMSALFYASGYGLFSRQTFLIIVTAAFLQDVFSGSLVLPSRELLFLPLSSSLRLRSQAIMSGIILPAGQGIGGLLVLALTRLKIPLTHYSSLTFSFAAGWIALLLLLQPRYRDMLSSSLKNTQLVGETLPELARSTSLEPILHDMLRHGEKPFVSLALDLLRYRSLQGFFPSIRRLALDSHPEVAAKAITLLGRDGEFEHLEILERTLHSPASHIRKATILAICRIKKDSILPGIHRWMESSDLLIRYTAMTGCGRYCGEKGRQVLQMILKKLVSAQHTEQRRLAANLLRNIGDPVYAPFLEILLDDPDATVRIIAVKACAPIQSPVLVSHLLRLYRASHLRASVLDVLEQMPEKYVPAIANAAQDFNLDETSRNLLFRVLGSIGGQTAQQQLWNIFSGDNPLLLRVAAGNALWRITLREPLQAVPAEDLDSSFEILCIHIEQLNQGCAELTQDDRVLWQLLHDQARLEIECLFKLLSFTYDIHQLEKIQYNFFSSGPMQQANALELLDDLLPRRLAPRIGELLDAFLQHQSFRGTGLSTGTIQNLIRMESWLKVIIHAYHQCANIFTTLNSNERELSTHIEKIAFLKRIPLFQNVPANYLLPLAEIACTTHLEIGDTLFSQGEQGDAMYLIRRGKIDIVMDDIVVNQMGPGDCIGEMAILDGTPRTASCIAREDAELLNISAQQFQTIVKSQTSVALAVLRTLSTRLRRQTERMLAQQHIPNRNDDKTQPQKEINTRHFSPERDGEEKALSHLLKKMVFLKAMPLFKGISEKYLVPLARMTRIMSLKKGEVLFHQGEPGDAVYCVYHGAISVQVNSIEVSCLRPGNCFGEMAILDGAPRSASCLAAEDSELLALSETDLEIILKSQPSVALAPLKILARKLRQQTRNTIQRQDVDVSPEDGFPPSRESRGTLNIT